MRTTTNITLGLAGQTLAYRVPQGRPTSATWSVFYASYADTATAEFSGSAVLDTVTTSIVSASGPSQSDPQRVNIVSTGVVTSKKYLISEGQRQEWVTPVEVGSGYIRVRHPLLNDYTTAATFVGTTITAAVDATWVANVAKLSNPTDPNPGYRVVWSIVLSTGTVAAYSFFDLVRAPITHQVDIDDVDGFAPGLMDSLPVQFAREQGRPLIDAAWKAVEALLAGIDLDSDSLRADQDVDMLVVYRALVILAVGGWRPVTFDNQADYVRTVTDQFSRYWEQHFAVSLTAAIDANADGAGGIREPRTFWSK